jgi:hypothetical protein
MDNEQKRAFYRGMIVPAVEEAIDLFVMSEGKHPMGIVHRDEDALCCSGHAISSYRGLDNPDGKSHAVASLNGAIKMVLKEKGLI